MPGAAARRAGKVRGCLAWCIAGMKGGCPPSGLVSTPCARSTSVVRCRFQPHAVLQMRFCPYLAAMLMTLATFGPLDWTILAAYFMLVIAVGVAVSRKNAGEGEFFLGSRNLPTWAVAVSLVATMLSTATFVGVPDTGY